MTTRVRKLRLAKGEQDKQRHKLKNESRYVIKVMKRDKMEGGRVLLVFASQFADQGLNLNFLLGYNNNYPIFILTLTYHECTG